MGFKPVNRYLPPRPRRAEAVSSLTELAKETGSPIEKLFAWADRLLSAGEKTGQAGAQEDFSGRLLG
jgi:hypothetical protein